MARRQIIGQEECRSPEGIHFFLRGDRQFLHGIVLSSHRDDPRVWLLFLDRRAVSAFFLREDPSSFLWDRPRSKEGSQCIVILFLVLFLNRLIRVRDRFICLPWPWDIPEEHFASLWYCLLYLLSFDRRVYEFQEGEEEAVDDASMLFGDLLMLGDLLDVCPPSGIIERVREWQSSHLRPDRLRPRGIDFRDFDLWIRPLDLKEKAATGPLDSFR